MTRAIFGIGQRELAAAAHVSVRELARIEAGEVQPGLIVLDRLDVAVIGLINERARQSARTARAADIGG